MEVVLVMSVLVEATIMSMSITVIDNVGGNMVQMVEWRKGKDIVRTAVLTTFEALNDSTISNVKWILVNAGKVIDPIGCPLNHYDHTFMCHGQLELKLRPKYSLLTLPSLGCIIERCKYID
ncbi:hypothetical protein JHK82_044966 [Glycine max]|nr:hypothetical protein JHK82_044966 [Glycine max]